MPKQSAAAAAAAPPLSSLTPSKAAAPAPSSSSSSSSLWPRPPAHPPLTSAAVLDWAMVALVLLFALRHPFVQRCAADPAAALAGARAAAAQLRAFGAAMAGGAATARERAALLRGLFDYALGSDIGAGGRADLFASNAWKTSLVLPAWLVARLPHVVAIWVRNFVAIHVVYFGLGGGWALALYRFAPLRDSFFPVVDAASGRREVPEWSAIAAQMRVSWAAMPVYVLVPTACEWLAERGLTRAYATLDEVGGVEHWLVWTLAYLFFVEWAIYWIHRGLHEVRWAYKWLHADHHSYNNKHDLSPLAGLAFHPVDGALQASPYLVGLFLMPVHFWTHMALLFFTGVWTASIHDTIRGNSEPIMGSKYHTYHHTAYRDNYGQFFVFFDWIHGTLTDPLVLAAQRKAERAAEGGGGADADPGAEQGDGYGVAEDAGAQDPVGAALGERAAREAKKAS